jgi:cell division inhibitor SepF
MHRMGVYLGLVEDEDYADGDQPNGYGSGGYASDGYADGRADDYADARGGRGAQGRQGRAELVHARDGRDYAGREHAGREHVRGYDEADQYAYDDQPTYQITALHPRTYNEARTIGEHFRRSTPVIMNLSEMDDADAKRLVDFAAGLTFGLHGRIERVTAKVFLLSPHNVTVTAQDKARIAENGFFNQS